MYNIIYEQQKMLIMKLLIFMHLESTQIYVLICHILRLQFHTLLTIVRVKSAITPISLRKVLNYLHADLHNIMCKDITND